MQKVLITDLTRFQKPERLCSAGIELIHRGVFRPMPYLRKDFCQQHGIMPGSIISGRFWLRGNREAPHVEDADYKLPSEIQVEASTVLQFMNFLQSSTANNVEEGFSAELQPEQKHFPAQAKPQRSLITLQVEPHRFLIKQDPFNLTKIRVNFHDSERWHNRLSLTDLGFFDYVQLWLKDGKSIEALQRTVRDAECLFLRIGLSRYWDNEKGQKGYWVQVNGVYPFPNLPNLERGFE